MSRVAIADIRRREIIEAFFEVIAEDGLNGATIRQVAEKADMSAGLLHRYYSSKEEMILAVIDFAASEYISTLKSRIQKFDSASDRLKYILSWLTRFNEFDLKWFRNFAEFKAYAYGHEAVKRALNQFFRELALSFVDIIKEGIKSKEFPEVNPVTVANFILVTTMGLIELYLVSTDNRTLDAVRGEINKVYMTMFGMS